MEPARPSMLSPVISATLSCRTFVCKGLNFAALKGRDLDKDFTVARYAIQVNQARLLVKHRHADPSSPTNRAELDQILLNEDAGQLCIDIGDFNGAFKPKFGYLPVWPSEPTFMRQGDDTLAYYN